VHGIVHAELRDYATARIGTEAWNALLSEEGLGGKVYLLSETYPDEELTALLGSLSRVTGESGDELLQQFGEACVPGLLRTYGTFVDTTWRTIDVVEHTERVIHRTVRLQHPGADPPRLRTVRAGLDEVHMIYASPRKLCAFGIGLINGLAVHYDDSVDIDQPLCMHRGDSHCEIVVRGGPVRPAAA
jgi:hypothetical protein